jgi:DNA replication protein DnaC
MAEPISTTFEGVSHDASTFSSAITEFFRTLLEAAIAKLDKFHLLILDDLAYVTKDQAETSVLFELISARYERRSLLITANQPFGEWGKIFPDQAMTVAVVDRLVHHATIFEMNVESYRRRAALERKRGRGRPPIHATTAANA